jgi:threonine synthase
VSAPSACFRCIAGCPGDLPLWRPTYRCPRCGDLLEVVHALAPLAERDGAAWRALFDARFHRAGPSGVWGKKEWVCPELRDDMIVSLDEGGTPLVGSARLARELGVADLRVKLCGQSHTGSFKDLGMTVLVSVVRQMITDGVSVRALACASTGDTSASLAAYAARAGIPAVVLLPRGKVSTAQLVQPLASGARVLELDTDFDGCMAVVQRLAAEGGYYLANSMNSLRLEGQKTVAIEIAQQLGWRAPDVVVIPGGNLGNVSALGAGFELMRALGVLHQGPRIVVAQAERANPLYRAFKDGWRFAPVAARPTLASAIQIGNPVSVKKAIAAITRCSGVVEQASEAELADAAARADRAGFYACPHTGVALAALAKLIARGEVARDARVVVISTASGLKFTEFKTRYHERALADVEPALANAPERVSADYDAVRRALDA